MDRCKTPPSGLPVYNPHNELRLERRLPPLATGHGIARDFVQRQLRRWGRDAIIDDALIIVGELFTNALMHARSAEYVVVVDWNGGMIRLEMWDSSSDLPIKAPVVWETDERGRGMHLIDALSEAWGARMAASGKCVWAVLPFKPKSFA